ncbi:MCE family protein [Rhodococcus sp. BP-252]|uniref:Mce family protein n=1 Tax=Rhodococcoides kyotonense TaxID=398843 RepID=A0A177YHW7_9NOCA|nr:MULTISPECIES: MCE family protein [Rhodococcus]MBY6414689.1 MCE family protein [Rhodococcus sp. BP-320]MBY6419593.1 MCE family protein [Rhodococcus sp. BP-321]MBY6424573.1 MCE family protein [Rhodococcus sp. BP-324]MBY6429570.1 MCE family protein [Rhodococcus sp. BP-323]MBY6434542.1 MCE family protein [Rhodococcus sp. BP-322]
MKKLAAAGLVLGLVAVVGLALTIFSGGFRSTVPVTVTSERAGLVMDPQAKVKLRGVEVGRVASISQQDGMARLQLDMNPSTLSMIPANAAVEIKSTTVFGAKYVNFVVPPDPSVQTLVPGAVISADNVTVEFNTLFQHLSDVLQQLEPEKLNATLGAVSSALRGRGEELGELLAESDEYLATINPSLPALQRDLAAAAVVTNVYADATPDLMRVLDNATTTSNTIVAEQANLDLLLMNVTGLADTSNQVLTENEQPLETALHTLTATTTLLDEYSPELTCFIVGLNKGRLAFGPLAGAGDKASIALSSSFLLGDPAYTVEKDLPKIAATGGPNCYGLPDFDPKQAPAPFVVADTGDTPYVPTTQPSVDVPTIFQFLFAGAWP